MKLFLIEDRDRWGYSLNIVRAADENEARKMATGNETARDAVEVTELATDGPAAILWCVDESPDTGGYCDYKETN